MPFHESNQPANSSGSQPEALRSFFVQRMNQFERGRYSPDKFKELPTWKQEIDWHLLVFEESSVQIFDQAIQSGTPLESLHFVRCSRMHVDPTILPREIEIDKVSEERGELADEAQLLLIDAATELGLPARNIPKVLVLEPAIPVESVQREHSLGKDTDPSSLKQVKRSPRLATVAVEISAYDGSFFPKNREWVLRQPVDLLGAHSQQFQPLTDVLTREGLTHFRANETWRPRETDKKASVLELLIKSVRPDLLDPTLARYLEKRNMHNKQNKDNHKVWIEELDILEGELLDGKEDFETIDAYYRTTIRKGVTTREVRQALELSNILELIQSLEYYKNRIDSELRLLDILPDLEEFGLQRIRNQVPFLNKLLAGFDAQMHDISLWDETQREEPTLATLRADYESHQQQALEILEQHFDIPSAYYEAVDARVNEFLEHRLQRIEEQEASSRRTFELSQFEEIREIDPVTLLQLAAGVGPFAQRARSEADPDVYRQYRSQARRKLYLMMRLLPVIKRYYEQADGLGLLPTSDSAHKTEILHRICRRVIRQQLWGSFRTLARWAEVRPEQYGWVRDMHLQSGQTITVINDDRVIKSPASVIEKALRDGDPDDLGKMSDLFGRALIIIRCPESLLQRTERSAQRDLNLHEIGRDGKPSSVVNESIMNDQEVVFQLMDTLKHHATQLPWGPWQGVTARYTPTPVPGMPFRGKYEGSRGKVRFAKFASLLTNQRTREQIDIGEIQLYSDLDDFKTKKLDDKRYQKERTSKPSKGSHRSLDQQIFPERRTR